MINEKFRNRFSIPHPDDNNTKEMKFAGMFERSSQDFKDEIDDIYFGASFKYDHMGKKKIYGDCMGKATCDESVTALLKIQEKYGVPVSLTMNPTFHPAELLLDKNIRNEFIKFIGSYYDKGVRLCTISNVHLMSTGILQDKFPEMKWKNTVNHLIKTAQEVADYAALGYNTIQLDRSLLRNMAELKKIKEVAKKKNVKTSLLVREGCMPFCPYKIEHDQVQGSMERGVTYFKTLGKISCQRTISYTPTGTKPFDIGCDPMPRMSADLHCATKHTLDQYLDVVDVFKFAGRLNTLTDIPGEPHCCCWANETLNLSFDCFSKAYNNNIVPFHFWGPGDLPMSRVNNKQPSKSDQQLTYPYLTKEFLELEKIALNCKGQCYSCHKCEDAFGIERFDSLLDLQIKRK